MATVYRMTGIYDQPLVDPDEWVAAGRPVGTFPTRTFRPGDVIEPRNSEERDRLLELGVVEKVEESSTAADHERQIEERRKAQEAEQREASEAQAGGESLEDLRAEAESLGLAKSGNKAELRDRIAEHRSQQG